MNITFPFLLLFVARSVLSNKPYIQRVYPESKKFNAACGKRVELVIMFYSNPIILSRGSWEFVNRSGVSQNLPPDSNFNSGNYSDTEAYAWLEFHITSPEHYGSYSCNLTNAIGSTNVTFEVLPEGPPDAPSNVKINKVTHNAIDVQWNVMWSNSFPHQQTVFWLLTKIRSEAIVYNSSKSYNLDIYNKSYSHSFRIKPKTNYSLKVWSENKFGSSEVVELEVRTPEQTKLIVTTVSKKEESVNHTTQNKNEELNSNDHREDKNSLLIVVIALSILMGTVSLACLTAYLVRRFRTNRQLLPTAHYQGTIKRHAPEESPQSREDNVYEELENDDHAYARISSTRNELPTAHYQGTIKHHAHEESPQSREDNVYEELENDDHAYARISSTRNEMNNYIDLI